MPVDFEKRDKVAYITINNPQKANILDKQISAEIAEIWREVWDDRDIRVAILTAVGDRHFCAGHNLASRPDITPEERERIRAEGVFWPLSGTVNGARIGADGRLGDHYPQIYKPGHRRDKRLGGGRGVLPDADFYGHTDRLRRKRAVQVRAAEPGLGRRRAGRDVPDTADSARRRYANPAHG